MHVKLEPEAAAMKHLIQIWACMLGECLSKIGLHKTYWLLPKFECDGFMGHGVHFSFIIQHVIYVTDDQIYGPELRLSCWYWVGCGTVLTVCVPIWKQPVNKFEFGYNEINKSKTRTTYEWKLWLTSIVFVLINIFLLNLKLVFGFRSIW